MRIWLSGSILCAILLTASGLCTSVALSADRPSGETVVVIIQGRLFKPDRTVLHHGRPTQLVFKNQDSELHAVVPFGLFSGESLNVAGNGAPEFGPEGLKRIVIPADGVTEIHFTPTKSGEYRYICDMPGHQMSGVIVVD